MNQSLHTFAQRVIPLAVIHQLAVAQRHLLLVVQRVAVKAQALQLAVCGIQLRAARRLIHAMRLHSNQPIFNNVDAPDAMPRTNHIQRLHQCRA